MTTWLPRIVFWTVAAFYVYGAAVHVLNIAGVSGFDWPTAPLKWQVLDIAYLALDVLVVVGLIRRWAVGYVAFFAAALSQIILYTVLRPWILDVPPEYAPAPEQVSYLDGLVAFHAITLIAVAVALAVERKASRTVNA